MKKLLSMLLVVAMLCAFFTIPAAAEGNPYVEIKATPASVTLDGKEHEVLLEVILHNPNPEESKIAGINFTLVSENPALVIADTAILTDAFGAGSATFIEHAFTALKMNGMAAAAITDTEVSLLKVKATLKDTATAGDYKVKTTDMSVADVNSNAVFSTDVNCTIHVNPAPVPVSSVTVSPKSASVQIGGTTNLSAVVKPDNADDKTVTWSSSDNSIATVKDGVVTGIKAGTVTITATAGGKSDTSTVTVNAKKITKIEITAQPTPNAFDVGATEPNWKTSGLKVKATYDDASVNENFTDYTVSGWNSATAQEITLTVNAGGKTATFKVTIQKITLQASDFLVTNNTYAFDNKPHQATVTCKKTGVTPVITYKQGETVVAEPKAAGTYDVYVSFAGNDKYNAFAAAKVGTLTIAECEHAFKWEKVANTTKGLVSQYQEVCEKCESIGKSEFRMELPIDVIVKAEKGTPGSKSFEVQYGTEKMTVATNGAKTYPAIITVKADTMDSLMEKLLRTEMVVKQTTADGDNWKIDKTVYTVTFEVENSGNVNATITAPVEIEEKIIDNDGKETTIKETEIKNFEKVSFTNIYSGKTGGRNPSSSSSNKTVESQKTFDAGIALYAGMAVLSLTGGAWMIGKKKEH